MSCKSCVYFHDDFPELSKLQEDEDILGECTWEPLNGVPHSWRWCLRERVGVYANEGDACPQYVGCK